MKSAAEHAALLDVVTWIDTQTADLALPGDERAQLALGCLDAAVEHQAAIALMFQAGLHGSMLAHLRVLAEAVVRGLWLRHCASEADLADFKKDNLKKTFRDLIEEFETYIGTPEGVLSTFKRTAWKGLNGFTHTGFVQVTRRHAPGLLGPNYDDDELCRALGLAGALGMIAAGELVDMSDHQERLPAVLEKMSSYVKQRRD